MRFFFFLIIAFFSAANVFAQSSFNDVRLVLRSSDLKKLNQELSDADEFSKIQVAVRYHNLKKVFAGFLIPRERDLVSSAIEDENSPILHFQGHDRRSKGESKFELSATLFPSKKLKITFVDRRKRLYTAYVDLKALSVDKSLRVKAHHAPIFIKFDHEVYSAESVVNDGMIPATLAANSSSLDRPYIIELSTWADSQLQSIHGSDTNAEIQSIVNDADTLYTPLDIGFYITNQTISTSGALSSTNANTLLEQIRDEANSSDTSSRDLTHLFTGKDLDGSTIGLAYLGVACVSSNFSYGLSEVRIQPAIHALTFAHEVGHNLSATHDDSITGIMNSSISGPGGDELYDDFSSLSQAQINSHLASNGSCLEEEDTDPTFKIKKIKVKASGAFTVNAKRTTGIPTGCEVSLYAAKKGNHLKSSKILTKAILISTQSEPSDSVFSFQASGIPNKLISEGDIHFKLRTVCNETYTHLSKKKQRTLKTGGALNKTEWITNLAATFSE